MLRHTCLLDSHERGRERDSGVRANVGSSLLMWAAPLPPPSPPKQGRGEAGGWASASHSSALPSGLITTPNANLNSFP